MSALHILLTKNYRIFRANWGKHLFIYLTPIAVLLVISVLQFWTNQQLFWTNPHPPSYQLSMIPRCHGDGCLTVGYIVQGSREPHIDEAIDEVITANNFTSDDVKQIDIKIEQLETYLLANPNKTQSIIVFCTDTFVSFRDVLIPCYGSEFHINTYAIVYNVSLFHRIPYLGSLKEAYPKDLVTVKLKYDIDRGILRTYGHGANVTYQFSDFPSRNSRFISDYNIFSQFGQFFCMVPYLMVLVTETSRLLKQKELKLRIGLNIVGVSHLVFYASELITYLVHILITTFVFSAAGIALDYKFWSQSLYWFNFAAMTGLGLGLGLFAFIVTTIVSNKNAGMGIIYAFVLVFVLLAWIFSGGLLMELINLTEVRPVIQLLRGIFNLLPPYHFCLLFLNISRKADSHFDTFANRFVQGTSFDYNDLFNQQSQSYLKPFPHTYTFPSPIISLAYIYLSSLLLLLIMILLDIFVVSNRGTKPHLRSAWKKSAYDSIYIEESESSQTALMQVVNLRKQYPSGLTALRGISLTVGQHEIVSLLGENGAGKSTLINIIVGILSASGGEVVVNGVRLRDSIQKIRQIVGVCPQFDILWDDLTAGEHTEMFLKLKGIEASPESIHRALEVVKLTQNSHAPVSIFSGGMRRRLSLAISLLGSPKLLILDEPTTGMDPQIRYETWNIISSLRSKLSVLMTTHNMEEAQFVSDRILILSRGVMAAAGTSQELKAKYGNGYTIKVQRQGVKDEQIIHCQAQKIPQELKKLNGSNVVDWSLHQTTLEEVFLAASRKDLANQSI